MSQFPITPKAAHVLKHLAGLEPLAVPRGEYEKYCQALNVRGYCRKTRFEWVITPAGRRAAMEGLDG